MAREIESALQSHHDHFATYHHHKEQMAYGATVLYLGAASWVAIEGPNLVRAHTWNLSLSLLVGVAALAGWIFIAWQLSKRRVAADMVAACTNLLSRRNATPESPFLREAVPFGDYELPHSLVDEVVQVRQRAGWLTGPRTSELLTHVFVFAWTLLAVVRLLTA